MRKHQIEYWTLTIVERIKVRTPVEDFRVEVKSEWPTDFAKAARRIAGHANAAHGEPILWVIGVDEEAGTIPGAPRNEVSTWYPSIQKQFEGLSPDVTDMVVPVEGESVDVVALLFDTSRAPFVVKNPAFNQTGGGPVEFEIPWREGTRIRSARRSDLLKILVPLQKLPAIDALSGKVHSWIGNDHQIGKVRCWEVEIGLYITPLSSERVVIPFHNCDASIWPPGTASQPLAKDIGLKSPIRALKPTISGQISSSEVSSITIISTKMEAVIDGPGLLELKGSVHAPLCAVDPFNNLIVRINLLPSLGETPISVEAKIQRIISQEKDVDRWQLQT